MIVKIKSFEEMPPYSKCCKKIIEAMKPYCGTEIEVDETKVVYSSDICSYCGIRTKINAPGYMYKHEYHILFFDYMDIDEGIY